MKQVVILQHRLLHYRTGLFDKLRVECHRHGIDLQLVHGQAPRQERARNDEGALAWATPVTNRFFDVGSNHVFWQPFPRRLRDADLVVLMQENRQLSNYPWLVRRLWSKQKVAYWGHGRNFQSTAPQGVREWWKGFLLSKVDWWFAYTAMTQDVVTNAGFPTERVTVLNNAIDSAQFQADLDSWTAADVLAERHRLSIPPEAKVGLFCGSLYPEKKLDLLLESGDRIRQVIPDFALVIVGDGPSMPLMRSAATSRPWMHLTGVRKGREKALAFRVADVMLNPGLVGLHVVDAFCAGLVMITTRGALHSPEFVYLKQDLNGIISGDTTDQYASAVIGLLQDPARLTRLKAAALADSRYYTLDNMVANFATGIERALAA